MSDTTVVIGVDNEHVLELEIAYRSWVANRPQMLNEHFMFVCDGNGGDLVGWTKRLEFCRQPKSKVVCISFTQVGLYKASIIYKPT